MNIFIIPSWYPSTSNPFGNFNKEQAAMMAKYRPNWSVGISTWGQGDEDYLVFVKKPKTWLRLIRADLYADLEEMNANLLRYTTPAFTWTRKLFSGNLRQIIRSNDKNLALHMKHFGKPDVLKVEATYPGALIAKYLSKKYGIPYIVTIRMGPFPFPEFLRRGSLLPKIDDALRSAHQLIATSTFLQAELRNYNLDAIVINNPVDLELFKPSQKSQSEEFLLILARLEWIKGIDLFLQAYFESEIDLPVKIAGEGSLMQSYQRNASKLGIADRIDWLGELPQKSVVHELQNCSFIVAPSRYETFGNVVAEAMATGTPILSTRSGGPSEMLNPATGYLCDISVESLAEGLKWMSANYQTFKPHEVRKNAVLLFSPDPWLTRIESVIKDLK
ncbi:MAG: glycosyltransferase [Bacteroidota bacterium]